MSLYAVCCMYFILLIMAICYLLEGVKCKDSQQFKLGYILSGHDYHVHVLFHSLMSNVCCCVGMMHNFHLSNFHTVFARCQIISNLYAFLATGFKLILTMAECSDYEFLPGNSPAFLILFIEIPKYILMSCIS